MKMIYSLSLSIDGREPPTLQPKCINIQNNCKSLGASRMRAFNGAWMRLRSLRIPSPFPRSGRCPGFRAATGGSPRPYPFPPWSTRSNLHPGGSRVGRARGCHGQTSTTLRVGGRSPSVRWTAVVLVGRWSPLRSSPLPSRTDIHERPLRSPTSRSGPVTPRGSSSLSGRRGPFSSSGRNSP